MKDRRIIWMSVATLLLGFVVAGVLAINSLQKVIQDNNMQMADSAATAIFNRINTMIDEPKIVAQAMANGNSFYEAIQNNDTEYYPRYLSYIKERFGYDTVFFINDADGNYYTHEGWSTNVIGHPTAEWYWKLRDSSKDFDLNVQLDEETSQKITVFMNQKIYDEDGGYIGLCGVGATVDAYNKIFENYKQNRSLEEYIIDGDGTVIIGDGPGFGAAELKLFLDKKKDMGNHEYISVGNGGCMVIESIDNTDWHLVVVGKEAEFSQFSYLIIRLIIAFACIMAFLAIGVFRWLSKFQEKYLHEAEMSKALAEGSGAVLYVDLEKEEFAVEDAAESIRESVSVFLGSHGRDVETVLNDYCQFFVHPDDQERMRDELKPETMLEKLKNRRGYFVQYKLADNDDGLVYFEMHVAQTEATAAKHTAFISFRNIDEQKTKEIEQNRTLSEAYYAANRANAAKTEFMASMSHDIRTPLNAIIGMTAIAETNIGDRAKVERCLSEITTSSKHLLGLVNEVLDMNRIESGKMSLNIEMFDMPGLLDDVVSIVSSLTDRKHQSFLISFGDIKHEKVLGDRERIQQCLMNLLGNAVKYTPEGGTIKLSVAERTTNRKKRGCYEFIVEDNGIGMTPEFIECIFEPFSRAYDQRALKEQGTGLGLTITQNIIQMMNGSIKVESRVNKGSRFIATIFLEFGDGSAVDEPENQSETSVCSLDQYKEVDFSTKRILLVEDNEINAEIATEIIGMTGLQVDHVWNGKEAIETLEAGENGTYDLVFMDIQMPVMNGYEAARAIRSSKRESIRGLPVIAMSANAFAEDVRNAKEHGMNDHIAKPLDVDRLMQILRFWLSA